MLTKPKILGKIKGYAGPFYQRSPSRVLDKEQVAKMVRSCRQPSYKHLKVFGCKAYSHIPKESRNKFDPKSKKCIFLGYGDSSEMGYRLWDPES